MKNNAIILIILFCLIFPFGSLNAQILVPDLPDITNENEATATITWYHSMAEAKLKCQSKISLISIGDEFVWACIEWSDDARIKEGSD